MLTAIATICTTVETMEQAEVLARAIVESHQAGCVQMDGPLRSLFRWEGKISDAVEFRLICKTLPERVETAMQFIRSRHPYELPELLVTIDQCSAEYGKWLAEQVVGP